jgi:hypothetical protein
VTVAPGKLLVLPLDRRQNMPGKSRQLRGGSSNLPDWPRRARRTKNAPALLAGTRTRATTITRGKSNDQWWVRLNVGPLLLWIWTEELEMREGEGSG